MTKDIEIARQWLQKAKNDLLCAENNLKSEIIPFDTVCFHFQQAVEKILKAYLIGNGSRYPFSHDLLLILEHVLKFNSEADNLRDQLAILMPYAVEIRYPDDWFMPTKQDAIEAKDAANKVLEWAKIALPEILFFK